MEPGYIGGIEGGATISTIVILDQLGNIVTKGKGPGTNHFLIGLDECLKRIAQMIDSSKEQAGISLDTPLLAMGLSLSGCETEDINQQIVRTLLENYPHLSERYAIGSDTVGSISATSNNGGVCCIAGTGSNTLLINPDGSKAQCGGWGYLLGDDGSAWSVSLSALRHCFKHIDGFQKPPHPVDKVWAAAKDYFNVKDHLELVNIVYGKFDKAYISGLCKTIAGLANEGDEFSKHLFKQAGIEIAKSLASVISQAHPDLKKRSGGIHILCVGSVWLSWNLLKEGFETYLSKHTCVVEELSLMRITTIMAVGAAYMAADKLNIDIPRDYEKNYEIFYNFQRKNFINNHS